MSAQTPRAAGPFSGLFGGASSTTHSLDARGGAFGLYQTILVPEEKRVTLFDPRLQTSSSLGGASGTLSYAYGRRASRAGLLLNATASVADYTINPNQVQTSASGSAALTSNLARRTSFSANAMAAYTPYYSFLPGVASAVADATLFTPEFTYSAIASRFITYSGGAGLTHSLSRRTTVGVSASARRAELAGEPLTAVTSVGGRATLTHRLSRTLSTHLGYSRDRITYETPGAARVTYESLDGGLDYADARALGPRTTLSFGSSTAFIRAQDQTHFRLNGDIGLSHGMGRTWSAAVVYQRTVRFDPGFHDPVLSDSLFGSLGGLLSRRVRWASSAGITSGQVGFVAEERFLAYTASSALTVAVARGAGVYVRYAYFRFDFPPSQAPTRTLPEFGRHTVTAGVTVWIPVFRIARGGRDSR